MSIYGTEPRSRTKHTKTPGPSTPGPSTSTTPRRIATAKTARTRPNTATTTTPSRGEDVFGDISTPARTDSPSGLAKGKGPLREYGDRFIPNREPESSHGCYDLLPEVDLGSDKEDKDEQEEKKKKKYSGKSDSETRREEVNAVFNKLLKDEMFPAIQSPSSRPSSPAHRNQLSPSRRTKLRKPMTHYTTNIPISSASHPVSSAGHTPLHHHPLPDMYPSDIGGKDDREMSPASTLPPLPQHGPATPISGHGRAPGAGPTSAHHRAHQSQMALTYEADEQTTPPRSRRKTKNEFEAENPDDLPAPDTPSKKRVLNFQSPTTKRMSQLTNGYPNSYGIGDLEDMRHDKYSLSPVSHESQQMLLSPRKGIRQMARTPFKVLDAPELTDDFYLNLVSWSTSNVLGVGLNNCVYLWSASTSKVTKLCDMGGEGAVHPVDTVTGLEWTNKGSTIALGTDKGSVEVWDAEYCKKIRTMSGHTDRVGALAWNNHILSTGSQDRSIFHRDTRVKEQYIRKLAGHHKQEVCGLKWNLDTDQLASGGNDNKMFIWSGTENRPTWRFGEHRAAVKAMAWSPHARGILASGGGTADKKIRFWNSLTGGLVSEWDTGSQVCNLMWSRNSNELVSTHGYAPGSGAQNQIHIWKYPSMTQVATLAGHTFRVLYLAMSPDGQTIVTGAGDETLRFWNAFELERGKKSVAGSKVEPVNPFLSKIR